MRHCRGLLGRHVCWRLAARQIQTRDNEETNTQRDNWPLYLDDTGLGKPHVICGSNDR